MIYKIKKGHHYSNFGWPKIYFKPVTKTYEVRLDESCWYDISVVGDHINKLFGFCYSIFPHDTSARIGWRPAKEKNKFDLFSYIYIDGHFYVQELTTIQYQANLFYKIGVYKGILIQFLHNDSLFESFATNHFPSWFSWFMHPYFGGQPTAPQDMEVEINEIKS